MFLGHAAPGQVQASQGPGVRRQEAVMSKQGLVSYSLISPQVEKASLTEGDSHKEFLYEKK